MGLHHGYSYTELRPFKEVADDYDERIVLWKATLTSMNAVSEQVNDQDDSDHKWTLNFLQIASKNTSNRGTQRHNIIWLTASELRIIC